MTRASLLRSVMMIVLCLPGMFILAQPCATAYTLTQSPLPTNGTYACGQSVTFCFTVTGWNSTNANWFHGIVANFGPGWDLATLSPGTPPATCGGSTGTWGWYGNVQGTAGTNIGAQGPGFFFDLDNDGNPGNNFGDFCVGATNWQFCWTISVLSPPACVNGLGLGVTFNTFGDSETGSWGSTACNGDAIIPSDPAVILSCPLDAGTSGTADLCEGSPVLDLFTTLGGTPDAGGSWTDPGGGSHPGQFDPATDVAGVYTYTLTNAVPPCTATSTVTVSFTDQPDAGADAILSLCSTGVTVNLLTALNGTPEPGGTWLDPSGAVFTGPFDPSSDVPGAYTYTIAAVAPCVSASATVTITIASAANAGSDATLTICSTDAPVTLVDALGGSPALGGSWTTPGSAPFPDTFDPSTDAAGVYTYTVPGTAPCLADQAALTVVVNTQADAGTDATATFCRTNGLQPLLPLLGGSPTPGGSWTNPAGNPIGANINTASGSSGTYTYTVNGLAPCTSASAELTITLVDQPDAGTDGTLLLCATGGPSALSDGLTGAPDAGGVWTGPTGVPVTDVFTPGTDAPGTYLYTVNATAPCSNSSSTVEVTVVDQPDAGADGAVTLCSASDPTDLFPLLGPDAQVGGQWTGPGGTSNNGTIDPSSADAGSYSYTLVAPAPCVQSSASIVVDIIAAPDPGNDGTLTICASGSDVDLFTGLGGTPDVGGGWTGPDNTAVDGVFTPGVDVAGTYLYTIIGIAPCLNSSAAVEVTEVDQPDAGNDGAVTLCSSGEPFDLFPLLGPTAQAGGEWIGPDGSPSTGNIDPSSADPGAYTYTLDAPAPCIISSSTIEVDLLAPPSPGTNGTLSICASGPDVDLFAALGGAPDVGGTWTDPSGSPVDGVIPAADALNGTYTYLVAGNAPCPDASAEVEVSVFTIPDAGVDGSLDLCDDGTAPVDLIDQLGGTPTLGGIWTDPMGTVHGPTFDAASDLPGTYTYTLNAPLPCPSASSTVTIGVIDPPPTGSNVDLTYCSIDPAFLLFDAFDPTVPVGGTWTNAAGAPVGGTFTPGSTPSGVYTYTLEATSPCSDGIHLVTISIQEAPDAGIDGSMTLCSSASAVDLSDGLTGTPDAGGTWTNPLGSATSNVLDPSTSAGGVFEYTISGGGICPDDQASVTVEVVQAAWSGTGGVVSLCSNESAVDPSLWLGGSPDPGGGWTDPDGATITSVDPGSAVNGTYSYTVAGTTPCPDSNTTVQLSITAPPVAGADGTVDLCAGDAPLVLSASLLSGASNGGQWTDGSGTTISNFDPVPGDETMLTYTVQGTGPCASLFDSALLTLTVNPTPVPGFTVQNASGCAPLEVLFTALPDPSFQTYQWEFGNGGAGPNGIEAIYTFSQPGTFPVRLTVVDVHGCAGTMLQSGAVFVSGGPTPTFTLSADRISVEAPTFGVFHTGSDDEYYQWVVPYDTLEVQAPFTWTIPSAEVGYYPVCLIATDSMGCSNSICLDVLVDDVLTVFVPNAFTPNGDDVNEYFQPSVIGLEPESYELIIADRWGIPVFASTDPAEAWNGSMNNAGELLPQDVYVWRLLARDQFGAERKEFIGTVTLLK